MRHRAAFLFVPAVLFALCGVGASQEDVGALIRKLKDQKDSTGGTVTCVLRNVPAGWGDPVFEKLEAKLETLGARIRRMED